MNFIGLSLQTDNMTLMQFNETVYKHICVPTIDILLPAIAEPEQKLSTCINR